MTLTRRDILIGAATLAVVGIPVWRATRRAEPFDAARWHLDRAADCPRLEAQEWHVAMAADFAQAARDANPADPEAERLWRRVVDAALTLRRQRERDPDAPADLRGGR